MLRAVLLDVNGTLTDTAAIGELWGAPELGDVVLDHAVSTAMVHALLDVSDSSFVDHLRAAVEVVIADVDDAAGDVERAVETAASLPARPGAAEALGMLKEAGLRVVALTNSGAESGTQTLERCGLAPQIDLVLGVDAVGTFKPDPDVYAYALSELDEQPGGVVMIATHPWDLAGAKHAGMRTAWVRHDARAWPSVFPKADLEADTLDQLAGVLLTHTW